MNAGEIIALQRTIGTAPDGFWGPKSIAKCQEHLRRLMPNPSPWPETDQASLTAFYGRAGDESWLVNVPAPVPMLYEGKAVRTIRCHERVAASMIRALLDAARTELDVVSQYDGCYNNRAKRGGTSPSLHARGAAIDLWANENAWRQSWPVSAHMPLAVMEAFAREGWTSAGAWWGYDAMHMEATSR